MSLGIVNDEISPRTSIDSYFWLGDSDTFEPAKPLSQIVDIFLKNNPFGGLGKDDVSGQMLIRLSSFHEHLANIAKAMEER